MAKEERGERSRRKGTGAAHRGGGFSIIEIEEGQRRRKERRAAMLKAEKAQKRLAKTREKRERPKMTRGKKLAVLGVIAIACLLFAGSGYRLIDLGLDKAVYEKEYEEKLAEKARLEKELSVVDDPAYVEQQARDRFHMLRDGEILYVFPEAEAPEAQ